MAGVLSFLPPPLMIYLCRNKRNGYVKIGFSLTPDLREKTLQSEEPELFFEHRFPGTSMDEESALHRKYAHRRLRGEWFELTPEDVAAIILEMTPAQELENESARRRVATLFAQVLPSLSDDQCNRIARALNGYAEGIDIAMCSPSDIETEQKIAVRNALGEAAMEMERLLAPVRDWIEQRTPF